MGDDRVSDLTWLKDVTRHMRCEDGMDNFIDDLVDEFDERRKQYRALEADNKRLHTTIKRMRERIRRLNVENAVLQGGTEEEKQTK